MKETRIAGGRIEIRSGTKPGIRGYAAVFNQLSEDLGGFRERVLPGAFKDCLATNPDVRCLFNHDPNQVLGRTKAGTLRLAEDAKGLRFDCDLPDTRTATDLMASIQRGDVDQCSFAFYALQQNWVESVDTKGERVAIRELKALDVFDVSPVTYPAYPQTTVDPRSFRSLINSRSSLPAVSRSLALAILDADFRRDMKRLDEIEPTWVNRSGSKYSRV